MKKILVWAKEGKTRPEIEPYKELFDHIFYLDIADFRFPVKCQVDKLMKSGRMFPFSKLGKFMKESVSGNMLVCFNDCEYCTTKYMDFMSRFDDNQIVMMDEGTALYFNKMINPPTKAAYVVNYILGVRLNISTGTDPKINRLIVRNPDRLPESKKRGHQITTQNDIFRDEEFLQRIQEKIAQRLPKKNGKSVLWLGQPVEEIGMGKHQEEALINIFRTFIKNGYRILVKSHPREQNEKYLQIAKKAGIDNYLTVIDLGEFYWIPIEAYVSLLAPDAVACFFSTAAGRIRDMGYICDIWYCFDLLEVNLEDDYLQQEIDDVHTFRIHSQKELEEKLNNLSDITETEKISVGENLKKVNLNQDIAYFEQFCGENGAYERAE